jgi:hypothetical protein
VAAALRELAGLDHAIFSLQGQSHGEAAEELWTMLELGGRHS